MNYADATHNEAKATARKACAWLPELIATGVFLVLGAIVARMIYHDSYGDMSTYSNRSFARPATGLSATVSLYAAYRLKQLPLWVRIVGTPIVFFGGYLAIGLTLIILNQIF